MTLGDSLTLVGLALTVVLYALHRAWERRRELDAAAALMEGVRHGMGGSGGDGDPPGWAAVFFGNVWEGEDLEKRAQADYDAVMKGGYNQVFEVGVPTKPLEALIVSPAAGSLIGRPTIERANHALFRFGVFNQLVSQQTDFWGRHLAEIATTDNYLPAGRRQGIAAAARAQSRMLHGVGIERAGADDGWFTLLTATMDGNIECLKGQQQRRWWSRPSVYAAVLALIGTAALAMWQGFDDDSTARPQPKPRAAQTAPSDIPTRTPADAPVRAPDRRAQARQGVADPGAKRRG